MLPKISENDEKSVFWKKEDAQEKAEEEERSEEPSSK